MKDVPMIATMALLASLVAASARAGDAAAGQKIYTGTCAACHQLKSYKGKSEAQLETEIKGIVAGSVKHPKKLNLSETDVENVATYIEANEPK